ncbi:MAG TPA: hypothetical protein VER17_08495 [Tepidisphaeraceae bacterium]|nr:hypothetical protein [Tepidisphaeraceae bacterium]
MARVAASPNGLTIAQLEQMLSGRRAELSKLEKTRNKLARKLDALDARIVSLGGSVRGGAGRGQGGSGGGGGRVRNEKSLNETIAGILGKSGKPMKVGDIADACKDGGYKTNSANFRGIVNQTLIKDKRFGSAGRGLYQLKK